MACRSEGAAPKVGRYEVSGMHEPSAGTPSPVTFEINGKSVSLGGTLGSHHVAGCIAALCAMVDADANGVTDLTIRTPDNLLRNHATGRWQLRKPLVKEFHPALKRMERRFDSVDWT